MEATRRRARRQPGLVPSPGNPLLAETHLRLTQPRFSSPKPGQAAGGDTEEPASPPRRVLGPAHLGQHLKDEPNVYPQVPGGASPTSQPPPAAPATSNTSQFVLLGCSSPSGASRPPRSPGTGFLLGFCTKRGAQTPPRGVCLSAGHRSQELARGCLPPDPAVGTGPSTGKLKHLFPLFFSPCLKRPLSCWILSLLGVEELAGKMSRKGEGFSTRKAPAWQESAGRPSPCPSDGRIARGQDLLGALLGSQGSSRAFGFDFSAKNLENIESSFQESKGRRLCGDFSHPLCTTTQFQGC